MNLGLLITTFNRSKYLQDCLNSVMRADIPEGTKICIIDDCSTDKDTIELINSFRGPEVFAKIFKQENKSIKDSLLIGIEFLFNAGCDIVTNLDADAIVRKDFISVLLALREKFPANLVTGFNCLTRNKNGSERHKVLETGDDYTKRKSVGGINMLFDRRQYEKWMKPALIKTLALGGNFDDQTCRNSMADGMEIITSRPSVVQHIGIGESAMGHGTGGEPPDVAEDFIYSEPADNQKQDAPLWSQKLQLPNVTLVCIDSVNGEKVLKAIEHSCRGIKFGGIAMCGYLGTSALLIDEKPSSVIHKKIQSKIEYSEFMMKELANYVFTEYMLVIQHDGFVLNPSAWREEWLRYDYIGAPWEWYADHRKVGNGGLSLRSTRLMKIVAEDPNIIPKNEPGVSFNKEEDHAICRLYRDYLEQTYDIKFAPIEEARKFSIEGWNTKNRTWNGEFGFHSKGVDISKSGITL